VVEWGTRDPSTGHFVQDDVVLRQSTAFWDMDGNEDPALRRYVIAFLEAVVSDSLTRRGDVPSSYRSAGVFALK
jgi:hypothetical protein